METQSTPVLSDSDYQELIAHRVLETLRSERQRARRWRWGILITVLLGLLGLLSSLYFEFESFATQPRVTGIDSPFNEPGRIEIVGDNFGTRVGTVEVYYKRIEFSGSADASGVETNSATVTLRHSDIMEWSTNRIVARLNDSLQTIVLDSLGNQLSEDSPKPANFDGLVPYISVVTADRQRSPVW